MIDETPVAEKFLISVVKPSGSEYARVYLTTLAKACEIAKTLSIDAPDCAVEVMSNRGSAVVYIKGEEQ